MSKHDFEITSDKIGNDCFALEIEHLQKLLTRFEVKCVKVAWGWGCKLDTDQLWVYTEVGVEDLASFLLKGAKDGIFTPFECDFYVASLEDIFEFKFCHEADIHFETSSQNLLAELVDNWKKRKMLGYIKSAKGWEEMT